MARLPLVDRLRSALNVLAQVAVIVLAARGAMDVIDDWRADRHGPDVSRASVQAAELAAETIYLPILEGGEHGLEARVTRLERLLYHFRRQGDTVIITGANLEINNGVGVTDGVPNGLGNLIVGYNERRGNGADARGGSHNLVLGTRNNYRGFAGIVAGELADAHGEYTSVLGGMSNEAFGFHTTVGGGFANRASGEVAVVSGGFRNEATGDFTTVGGGRDRKAEDAFDWVAGGLREDE